MPLGPSQRQRRQPSVARPLAGAPGLPTSLTPQALVCFVVKLPGSKTCYGRPWSTEEF